MRASSLITPPFSLSLIFMYVFIGLGCSSHETDQDRALVQADTIDVLHSASDAYLNLLSLPSDAPVDTVFISVKYDHSFKKEMEYEAIPLKPLLEYWIDKNQMDAGKTDVVFICKDGYMPTSSVDEIYLHGGGYLAFRDTKQGMDKWDTNVASKYDPLYLVWDNLPYENKEMVWPYGLTGLQLVQRDSVEQFLFPEFDEKIAVGYHLFQQNCGKCHAINTIGGIFGPEFNVPKNITEYWDRKDIIAFAQNPQSYRNNSKMPSITHLSESEFDHIVDYLEYISQFKLIP